MYKNHEKFKAFTLAEIFIAMIVLAALVSVCLSFLVNRVDYSREYGYYTAYKNIVNVVTTALHSETYLSTGVEETTCGLTANKKRCRAFRSASITKNLCEIFSDYFNTRSASCTTTFTSAPSATESNSSLVLTNGMVFYFNKTAPETIADLNVADTLEATETQGYTFWVDVNGHGIGEDKENYDIMKFYVTRSGKVIPAYGTVSGMRGYDFTPAAQDAAGNTSLLTFDVIYVDTTDLNHVTVLEDARHVSFPKAACTSGYININTNYCNSFKDYDSSSSNWTKDLEYATNPCNNAVADCKIRLVKKLKRLK